MGTANIHQLTAKAARTGGDELSVAREKALLKRASEGDREAFRHIVSENRTQMLAVARSVVRDQDLAEDVVQESFIKAYRALPDFRGDALLSSWLHRITFLTALDMRRQQKRHAFHSDDDAQDSLIDTSVTGRSDNELIGQQTRMAIDRAMQKLSPFEYSVFCLRHLQNFSLKDISLVLDRSEGTIKSILFRAIHKMRSLLADEVEHSSDCTEPRRQIERREQC